MTANRTIVEIHILQTMPPSNLNRDDTGSPKKAVYGGVTRARVSSQAWKRPTRLKFRELVDPNQLGIRTKRVVEVLTDRILRLDPAADPETAQKAAQSVLQDAGGIKLAKPRSAKKTDDADGNVNEPDQSSYLLFLGSHQYDELAAIGKEAIAAGGIKDFLKNKDVKKRVKGILQNDRAIDVALFGRMVADDTDLNVDAAAQVAHAISVQRVDFDSDYFTAVDDVKQDSDEEGDAGAAMIGDVEFNSATFYRYANVDVDRLLDTLGDANATTQAVTAFVDAFATTVPNGKINTFAHNTLPDLVVVNLRDTQAVNLVGAFERPIAGEIVANATKALVEREQEIDASYGTTPVRTWVVRVGKGTEAADQLAARQPLHDVLTELGDAVAARLVRE
ncbi:type I-E CRISPR-associated protein Cas7/Cse4/CasC [uncultured Bifidobacterium sp.]|uniref:type I-E CRISPR-associated protein Cas7/Cse4/CasC n=1 Tax=uncultured Bifidobacterium sp. TaxID=165187 RepID=UPI002594AEAE|nr:type I-E CRISPR-associated protein Cas7/Cse4/CasC [uncultured Bifidobacterium sp.]